MGVFSKINKLIIAMIIFCGGGSVSASGTKTDATATNKIQDCRDCVLDNVFQPLRGDPAHPLVRAYNAFSSAMGEIRSDSFANEEVECEYLTKKEKWDPIHKV